MIGRRRLDIAIFTKQYIDALPVRRLNRESVAFSITYTTLYQRILKTFGYDT